MTARYTTGWIPIRFTDTSVVDMFRSSLYTDIGEPDIYHIEDDPHISMFGFDLPTRHLESFQNDFQDIVAPLVGQTFEVNDVDVYPNIDNPMVVSLDPDLDLKSPTNDAIDALEQYNGNVRWGPHPPHITLMKGGNAGLEDHWGELPTEAHDKLRDQFDLRSASFSLTIDSIALET